jgi:hypothetical protein
MDNMTILQRLRGVRMKNKFLVLGMLVLILASTIGVIGCILCRTNGT